MMTLGRYVLYGGKTLPVKALVRSNGVDCVCVQDDHGIALIPAAVAVEAPKRSTPRLVCIDGERISS